MAVVARNTIDGRESYCSGAVVGVHEGMGAYAEILMRAAERGKAGETGGDTEKEQNIFDVRAWQGPTVCSKRGARQRQAAGHEVEAAQIQTWSDRRSMLVAFKVPQRLQFDLGVSPGTALVRPLLRGP